MWHLFPVAILSFCGILLILKWTFPYLSPMYLGLLLALAIDVPVSYLEGMGLARPFTSFFFICLSLLGLPFILLLFAVQVWQEMQELLVAVPWPDFLSEQVSQLLASFPALITQLSSVNLAELIRAFYKGALIIPDLLLIWLLTNFCAYFFCKDKRMLIRFLNQALPNRWRTNFFKAYRKTYGVLWNLLRIQLILLFISTAICISVFSLLNLPYAVLLGILAGFADFLPIVGPGLIYLVLALNQIWLGNFLAALALGLVYLILLLIRQFGQPQLLSGELELHPLVVVISGFAGFRLWGLLGALAAPVLVVVIRVFFRIFTNNESFG